MIVASPCPITITGRSAGSKSYGRPCPRILALGAIVAIVLLAAGAAPARADPFTVSGVEVDVTADDASAAKLKAIGEAQVIAFKRMVRRIAAPGAGEQLDSLGTATVGPLMAALSVEEERSGPGRYIARLTVSFLPDKVRELLGNYNVRFTRKTAPPVLLLPVWDGPQGPTLWEDPNPWRAAWESLDLTNALTPIVLPLGDVSDRSAISAEQALAGDMLRLDALKTRYDGQGSLIATATPAGDNAVRIRVTGEAAVGPVDFEDTVTAKSGGTEAAVHEAAEHFLAAMQDRWKETRLERYRAPAPEQTVTISVPFAGLGQWNNIRSRLLSSRSVSSLDVDSLSASGAVVRVTYLYNLEVLQVDLSRHGFALRRVGNTWVLQPTY